MFVFITPILRLLGAGKNTFVYERQYAFCVIVLGGIPTVLSNVMSNLLRSAGYSREAGFGVTMGGLINIALDPLFMFLIMQKGDEMLGVGIGICQGMLPLVAYNFSSGDHRRMRGFIRFSLKVGLVIGVGSVILYEIFAGYIMRAFISETDTLALGTDFLRIRVLATPLMFMSFFTVFVFQGFGRGNTALFLGIMRWLAFNIPCSSF